MSGFCHIRVKNVSQPGVKPSCWTAAAPPSKLVIAEASDRRKWRASGVRVVILKSGLSLTTVYTILDGRPVCRLTLATFRRAIER
jgi:hypothetical protein